MRAALSRRAGPVFAAIGVAAAGCAAMIQPAGTRLAAAQDWPPFVLVAGLLLIGLVADGDGLFEAAGQLLGRLARRGGVLFLGAAVIVGVVTATLNLDTSVAFLTPVLVHTSRSRGTGDGPLLYGCLLLSNAGSLLLPGSNLTNLIVLGEDRLSGGAFLARMWLPWIAALVVTGLIVAAAERRGLQAGAGERTTPHRPRAGAGALATAAATILVVALGSAALPVAAVGAAAVSVRMAQRRVTWRRALDALGAPVLAGLFGVAVALGALGRAWSGASAALMHLNAWATAGAAAAAAVLVNNLPAASLLASRPPPHPFALLIGLNLGPNLFVTGSLAWILWLRTARTAGADPSIRRAARLGALSAPLAMAAALAALALTGPA